MNRRLGDFVTVPVAYDKSSSGADLVGWKGDSLLVGLCTESNDEMQ